MVSYSTITVMTLMLASIAGVSMLGKSCDHYNISPPMVYILFGILTEVILHSAGLSFVNDSDSRIIVLLIAELTLVIVLFHDASTVNIKELQLTLPLRLLVIGLPITLTVMYFISRALFPDIGFSGALLIAAALTPTDAGLGAPTILNPKVPSRVRQALNVESGINDGLITPVVLIAIAGLEEHADEGAPNIPKVALIPISIALALAVVIGPFYAWLLDRSVKDDLSTQGGRELSLVMIPLLLYSLSVMTGANAFITAFLAGGIFGYFSDAHHKNHDLSEMLESVTDFLSGAAWFLAGEILVATFYDTGFHWQWAAIAFLALVPCRMIPVYFSLLGTDLDTYSKGFIGWFGPRGLATVIFALLAEEDFELSKGNVSEERMELLNEILGALLFTVTISVFAHGVSAAPLAEKYDDIKHAETGLPVAHMDTSLHGSPRIRTRGMKMLVNPSMRVDRTHFHEFVMHHGHPHHAHRRGSHHHGAHAPHAHAHHHDHGGDGRTHGHVAFDEPDPDDVIQLPYTKPDNIPVVREMTRRFTYDSQLDHLGEEEDDVWEREEKAEEVLSGLAMDKLDRVSIDTPHTAHTPHTPYSLHRGSTEHSMQTDHSRHTDHSVQISDHTLTGQEVSAWKSMIGDKTNESDEDDCSSYTSVSDSEAGEGSEADSKGSKRSNLRVLSPCKAHIEVSPHKHFDLRG